MRDGVKWRIACEMGPFGADKTQMAFFLGYMTGLC